ncbi:MAG: hypothetical protein JWO38_3178 [Gemmataceae bacterium]|nr:hypothetical protein [Gemmataceae bacterium]
MPPHRRFQAPTANGEVLAAPGFDTVPGLVEANRLQLGRADVTVGGLPLRDLRALARREVLAAAREGENPSPGRGGEQNPGLPPPPSFSGKGAGGLGSTTGGEEDVPLLLAGHQPELSHPGVWVKNFALNGLARTVGGIPLNLVVDNDTLKTTSLRVPTFRDRDPESVHLEAVPFDRLDGEMPFEARGVLDAECFRTFADRAAPLWQNWGYEPLLPRVWGEVAKYPTAVPSPGSWNETEREATVGERFAHARRQLEREWGCDNREVTVSRLARTSAFVRFAGHVLADLPRFRGVYNGALRQYRRANGVRSANHPAPDLGPDEAPFWVWRFQSQHRHRLVVGAVDSGLWLQLNARDRSQLPHPRETDGWRRAWKVLADFGYRIRPRALTLTLFARLCLGDFFIHGIGGGKYDEVTDTIIRDYFGIEPPAYQVLSATLHLPLPAFPAAADADRAWRDLRDLTWNPQRHLPPDVAARPDVAALVREKAALAAAEPPYPDHPARREWFRALLRITDQLRQLVAGPIAAAEAALARTRAEAHANALLLRRDFAWVLYPEEMLRPFLQRFLDP